MRFVERRILPLAWSASPREHSDLRALASTLQGLIGDEELVRDPDFALVLATMANAESRAEEALTAGASPARRFVSSGGEVESTALTLAAELRHYRLVERFARAYDTSDWVAPLTAARYEPIARAAASGDILALQELLPGLTWTGGGERDELDGGTSPPCSDSPLFHAAENGQPEMVRVLLDAGISIDGACDPAYPVLAAAIRGENPIVVQMLIDRGAPLRTHVFDSLMYCITNDAADVVSVILRASVSIDALPAAALLPGSAMTVLIDPLTYAVAMLSAASVRALLEAGANPNGMARTIEVTPLEWAARIGHRQILRLLIEAGADTDTLFRPGPDGRSAMDLVSVRGWKDLEDFIRSVSKR